MSTSCLLAQSPVAAGADALWGLACRDLYGTRSFTAGGLEQCMSGSFAVSSHIGVGPLRFGMTRDQVRTALPVPFEAFARTPDAEAADYFPAIPAFAYYSKAGTLQAVEFAPDAAVNLGDFYLTGRVMSEVIEHLARVDPQLEQEPSGCTSKTCGVGLWSEGGLGAPPQSVIVFERGYYD